MSLSYVDYELVDGYVHHWLAAGPQTILVQDLDPSAADGPRTHVAHQHYEPDSGITTLPVERGPLSEGTFTVGDYEGTWTHYRCREDHLVDHTPRFESLPCGAAWYLRSWAYTQLVSDRAQEAALTFAVHGPADLWVNGEHVRRWDGFSDRHPQPVHLGVMLQEGPNEVLVRFEQVATGASPHAMALLVASRQVPGAHAPVAPISVRLPTAIEQVDKRNRIERVLGAAYLDQDVYGRDEAILVHWPDDLRLAADATVRLQTPSGRIYAEAHVRAAAGAHATLGSPYQVPPGPCRAILMPRVEEYYDDNIRVRRELGLWGVGNNAYSEVPQGTYPERRQEALLNAAYREGSVFAEIATMALGRWSMVETAPILQAVDRLDRREAGAVVELVALLGMLHRFGGDEAFPEVLRAPLEACILDYSYRHDQAPGDAMGDAAESHSLLCHTAQILAGQLYPDRPFGHGGRTGAWHRQQGEELALAWLARRGSWGFEDWDSSASFARILVALSHLVDLAEADPVFDMATVLMDKTLLSIALNSYRGVFGSSQGYICGEPVGGGLLAPTAGITRLLWGQGTHNHHLAGAVSLACLEGYQVPPIMADIAACSEQELWNRERHAAGPEAGAQKVNKVTYRTPDYMLSSAQDYHPGESGWAQHIWQATLGPGAIVFANHPACASTDGARRPAFWLGNQVLPRVAQWKDVLIAIHNLPEDDWMGFTHAYFPTRAFDEHVLRGGWAFARKGDGYLALAASRGLELITTGHSAYRELRCCGRRNVWLCQMGRAALDGDFAAFQTKVLALDVSFDGLSVTCGTLRGETLAFGWEGPFLRDGQEQPLSGFKHYENPYTTVELGAEQMEVRSEAYLLRLKFGGLQEAED